MSTVTSHPNLFQASGPRHCQNTMTAGPHKGPCHSPKPHPPALADDRGTCIVPNTAVAAEPPQKQPETTEAATGCYEHTGWFKWPGHMLSEGTHSFTVITLFKNAFKRTETQTRRNHARCKRRLSLLMSSVSAELKCACMGTGNSCC